MRKLFYTLTLMALAAPFVCAQEFDDIYYNPKKDKSATQSVKKKKSYYVSDFGNMDVDEYNRRGQYYTSPIDTIGRRAESDEDFVYTQQIQKYYNPTIVVDNADVLQDVLLNSYGNVDIVFDNGLPTFAPLYSWPYYTGFYAWNDPSYWGWGGGWRPSWAWGPSWSWSWGWGPSWTWGPSWGWGGYPHYADYRPNGRYPNRPGSNWASNTRPGRPGSMGRPANGRVPSYGVNNSRTNNHRTYQGTIENGGYTHPNGYNGATRPSGNRGGYTINSSGHRTYGGSYNSGSSNSSNNNRRSYNTTTNRNNNRSYNSNTNQNNRSTNSYNSSRSYNSGRSYGGGSFGGGSRGGGGGSRGRHR